MTLILAVSLAVNLLLAYKIRKGSHSTAAAEFAPLLIGTAVSPLKAHSLDGREATISYKNGQQPLVIYVFTPQCPWCRRNLANLKTVLARNHDSYRFIALSLTDKDLEQYIADKQKQIDIPIFANPAEESRQEYRLGSTPQTIVVSPDGRVLQNWVGAYTGAGQIEIEKFFGVNLPGLSEN
jgi:peroxiredoxin